MQRIQPILASKSLLISLFEARWKVEWRFAGERPVGFPGRLFRGNHASTDLSQRGRPVSECHRSLQGGVAAFGATEAFATNA